MKAKAEASTVRRRIWTPSWLSALLQFVGAHLESRNALKIAEDQMVPAAGSQASQ